MIRQLRQFAAAISATYTRWFRLDEIAGDMVLRWFGGAVLLGFHSSFKGWQTNYLTTVEAVKEGNHVCWPFFQNCADFVWMQVPPHGYSQMLVFMVLFALIVLAAYGLIARRIALAHGCIAVLLLAKIYFTLINFYYNANYDYYHTVFALIFLFVPHRRFFGSLSVVLLYFLSTLAKIHPSWVLGEYFSALDLGLPIFPKGSEALFTNMVIFMEMIGAWFLFSHRVWLQRTVFGFFCLFHLYSGILVSYHYPTIVMPALLIFFGPYFTPFNSIPRGLGALPGWLLMGALCVAQSIAFLISGDAKLTLEGNFYGLYMFEANHQCRLQITGGNGSVLYEKDSPNARLRCDPWPMLTRAQQHHCASGEAVGMRLIHSINGGPFYEIVKADNICNLQYRAFAKNDWIKDETTAKMVGTPRSNFYR